MIMPLAYFSWISVNFDFPARADFMLVVYVRERFSVCVCVQKTEKNKIKRGSTTQKAQKRFCTNSHVSHFLFYYGETKLTVIILENNCTISSKINAIK